MDWKKCISQQVGAEQLPAIETFVSHMPINGLSSIDSFYEESRGILSSTPTDLDPDGWMGASNLVALVSLTENYFRSILGAILKICSITKKNASENTINFGSVLWNPVVERGVFEHISFSDSKKIAEITRKYVGCDVSKGDLAPILDEFSKVCELRHGVVHSGRFMAGKNALVLDYPSSRDLIKISIGYGQLQSIASICTTLVVAYNQKMFELLCTRWATGWRGMPSWDPQQENKLFKSIWDSFYSNIDKEDGSIENGGTWVKCRNLLKREFHL